MTQIPSKFDVVVVGGGPAGATAAAKLAEKGFRVLLVERGRGLGSKQVYGGRVYAGPVLNVFRSHSDMPVHRWVCVERLSVVDGDETATLEYRSPGCGRLSFTVYLGELVKWIGSLAESYGAIMVDEVRVDRLLVKDGRIYGVAAGVDRVYADYVVDAEGVNRLLLERAGLASRPGLSDVALGVKETIKVSPKRINEFFGVNDDEGVAWMLLGSVTDYIPGGAFVYTNRDTVSVGVVLHLDEAIKHVSSHVSVLVEKLRNHPLLAPLLRDGDIIEYSAHLTIESPGFVLSRLSAPGLLVVGDAAGLLVNTGFTVRGVDLAVKSGYLAAEGIECAHRLGDLNSLGECYENRVRREIVVRELERFKEFTFLLKDSSLYRVFTKFLISLLRSLYSIEGETPSLKDAMARAHLATPIEDVLVKALNMVVTHG